MFLHHESAIKNVIDTFSQSDEVLALMVGGSVAHGFENEESDVDILILISEEDYQKREQNGALHYYNKELCGYESGYVDGKYITLDYLQKVADSGNEPTRFAFESAILLFSKIEGLDVLLKNIVRYPILKKEENIRKFYGQLEAWRWFCYEALKKENKYLLNTAVSNLILFGGRLVLAHNEILYPYHKWFLRVLENAKEKPEGLLEKIELLIEKPVLENIEEFYNCIAGYKKWVDEGFSWPCRFMTDTELAWLTGTMNVADI